MNNLSPLRALLSSIGKAFPEHREICINEYFVEAVRAHYRGVIPSTREIYYAILNRYPEMEIARTAYMDFEELAFRINAALLSNEAYKTFLDLLIREYPLIKRTVFIHIAKSAGSFIRETLSMQTDALIWNQSYEVTSTVRRPLLNDLIRLNRGLVQKIFVTGHYDLPALINRKVIAPFNRVFTVLREPSEIIVSALNYYLTLLFSVPDSDTYPFVRNIIARGFSLDDGPEKSLALEYANYLLFSEEFKSQIQYPISRYFGKNIATALENCELYHIEFVGIESVANYLRDEHGINEFPADAKINVSEKFVSSVNALSSHGKAYVFDDLCQGDSGLYQWIHKSIKNSGMGWTLLP